MAIKHSLLREDISVYNPLADGSALNDTTLSAAITSIGSDSRTLMLTPGTWTIANNLIVPANVTLWVTRGATVTVDTTKTLTLNGSVNTDNPDWYTGLGTVIFNFRQWPLLFGFISNGGEPVVPSSSLALAAFATDGFVVSGAALWPVFQPAAGVTLPDSPTVWVALHLESQTGSNAPTNWTGITGTHYIHRSIVPLPATPDGGTIFSEVTISGSVITVVDNFGYRSSRDAETRARNIESYGADIQAADNSVALQRTFDLAGEIIIPEGAYTYATTLVIKNSTKLTGAGQNLSFLEYTGTGDAIQIINLINGSTAAHITLEDFAINYTGTASVPKFATLCFSGPLTSHNPTVS